MKNFLALFFIMIATKLSAQSITGDEILITGPTTGGIQMHVPEIRVDNKQVEQTKKGEHFSIRVDRVIRRSDKLYKLVDRKKPVISFGPFFLWVGFKA